MVSQTNGLSLVKQAEVKTLANIESYRLTGSYCIIPKIVLILSKMLCHIVFQTTSTYCLICLLVKNEKYEYFREFCDQTMGKGGAGLFYAVILFLQFPGMLLLQNTLATIVLHFWQKPEERRAANTTKYAIKQLKTNYTISHSLTVFCPKTTKDGVLLAYFFYLIPLYIWILILFIFNTTRPLCSTFASEFLLNNRVKPRMAQLNSSELLQSLRETVPVETYQAILNNNFDTENLFYLHEIIYNERHIHSNHLRGEGKLSDAYKHQITESFNSTDLIEKVKYMRRKYNIQIRILYGRYLTFHVKNLLMILQKFGFIHFCSNFIHDPNTLWARGDETGFITDKLVMIYNE